MIRPATLARALLLAAALQAASGCAPGPRPIAVGEDACEACHMVIADGRFATELVTSTGKVYTFDSVECLAAFYLEEGRSDDARARRDAGSLWVTAFNGGPELVSIGEVFFLRSDNIQSPMGMSLAAFRSEGEGGMTPGAAVNAFGGEVLTWDEVLAYVEASGGHGGMGHGTSGHGEEMR